MKHTPTPTSKTHLLTHTLSGAWARPRPSTSRTPQQSRSSNASPAPSSSSAAPATTAAKPATTPAAPTGNVWAQRAAAQKPAPAAAGKAAKKEQGGSAAAAASQEKQVKHVPVNNFNDDEVRQMMGQGATSTVYKVDNSAKASDRKFCHGHGIYTQALRQITAASMANGKNFWAHLAEQVTAARQKEGEKQ